VTKKDKKEDLSPLQGENQFLTRLVLGLLVVTAFSWVYTLYFMGSVVGPAEEALAAESDEGVKEAIAALEATHFFSNIVTPDSLIPDEDPVLGGSLEGDALQKASQKALDDTAAAIQSKTNEEFETVLSTLMSLAPEGKEKREFLKTTFPEMAAWATLEKGKFGEKQIRNSSGKPTALAQSCGTFGPCIRSYAQRHLPRLAVYFLVSDARTGMKAEWSEGELALAYRFPTALIKGFGESQSSNPFSKDEKALVSSLLDAQKVATKNGLIFSVFISIVLLTSGVTRFLSDRVKPADYS